MVQDDDSSFHRDNAITSPQKTSHEFRVKSRCCETGRRRGIHTIIMYTFIYNTLLAVVLLVMTPWYGWRVLVSGKYRTSTGPKLGFHAPGTFDGLAGSPRIWIHAVSVGEVTAAAPIVAGLRKICPEAVIFLSTSTETGQEAARRLVPHVSTLFYFPLDIPRVIRGVLDQINPDLFVIVETELWPNFIRVCRERSVKVIMVNGRLSPRSFRKYRATRFFWKGVLEKVTAAGVISETDRSRLTRIGMEPGRIDVMGNAKYDGLVERTRSDLRDETARLLDMNGRDPVIVAGSTHEGEEVILIDLYERFRASMPNLRLILVPRHVHRVGNIVSILRERGLPSAFFSDIEAGRADGRTPVVVVDVMGRLFSLYGIATVVFCGGSMVPRGGQNVLEAAAWGKVVLHGTSMEDFAEEGRLLAEAGAAIPVGNREELAEHMERLLADREERIRRGQAGRRVVEENQGAARRYAEMILRNCIR